MHQGTLTKDKVAHRRRAFKNSTATIMTINIQASPHLSLRLSLYISFCLFLKFHRAGGAQVWKMALALIITSLWRQNLNLRVTFHKHMLPTIFAFRSKSWSPKDKRRSSLREKRILKGAKIKSIDSIRRAILPPPLAPALSRQGVLCPLRPRALVSL